LRTRKSYIFYEENKGRYEKSVKHIQFIYWKIKICNNVHGHSFTSKLSSVDLIGSRGSQCPRYLVADRARFPPAPAASSTPSPCWFLEKEISPRPHNGISAGNTSGGPSLGPPIVYLDFLIFGEI
jgi:hypothetical protein